MRYNNDTNLDKQLTKMTEKVIFYHSRDFDGIASGKVLQSLFPDAKMVGYHYGEPYEMPTDCDVFMADVSLPMEEMWQMAKQNKTFTWIDHHKSVIDDYEAYAMENGFPSNLYTKLRIGLGACALCWEYRNETLGKNDPMPYGLELLAKYDVWKKEEDWDMAQALQFGLRTVATDLDSFPFEALFYPSDYIEKGFAVQEYMKGQYALYAKRAFVVNFKGYRVLALNTDISSLVVFESVYNEEEHDIVMPFRYDGSKWHFSLYTTKDIDCSALAKSFGGGGHPKAAGFQHTNMKVWKR